MVFRPFFTETAWMCYTCHRGHHHHHAVATFWLSFDHGTRFRHTRRQADRSIGLLILSTRPASPGSCIHSRSYNTHTHSSNQNSAVNRSSQADHGVRCKRRRELVPIRNNHPIPEPNFNDPPPHHTLTLFIILLLSDLIQPTREVRDYQRI